VSARDRLAAGPSDEPPDNRLREPIRALLDRAPQSWHGLIEAWRDSAAGQRLIDFIQARQAAGATIYPSQVFRALQLTARSEVRVVILGQDPYHGPGQANGLAFAVPSAVQAPPSLRNIGVEIRRDFGLGAPIKPDLACWAGQGVLLLNTCLSVEQAQPGSHAKQGWEALTASIVELISADPSRKVFMLWGAAAQAMAPAIERHGQRRHCLLQANHPSPLSARRPPQPFVGCGHFSSANRFLAQSDPDRGAIDWLALGE
jgi:uracil-DNA glycosylase